MAFIVPTKLGQGSVATGAGTLVYTAPTGITTLVKCIDLTNTSAGTVKVNLYLVPIGGTASAANCLIYGASVAGSSLYQWTGTQVLATGGFLQAIADGAGCTINAAGGEYVV